MKYNFSILFAKITQDHELFLNQSGKLEQTTENNALSK